MSRLTHGNNAIMITFVPSPAILHVSFSLLTTDSRNVSNVANDKFRDNKVITSRERIIALIRLLYTLWI